MLVKMIRRESSSRLLTFCCIQNRKTVGELKKVVIMLGFRYLLKMKVDELMDPQLFKVPIPLTLNLMNP